MIPSVEEGKNAFLKVYTAEIKRDHPSWTFARCWQAAQAEHPELQESFDDGPPSSMPAYTPPHPGQVAADADQLEKLLKKYMSGNRRVEARKPREDESVERVEAIEPSSSKPFLVRGIDVGLISRIAE